MNRSMAAIFVKLAANSLAAAATSVPSVPDIDAPELAKPGANGVGFRSVTFIHNAQPDLAKACRPKGR